MRKHLLSTCFGLAALFAAGYAAPTMTCRKCRGTQQWVIPAGNFADTRYSELKQINTENVDKLAPAWTFSTGVLRGHEGAPLVIGDVMYVHAPFPNIVFALDLNNDGKILWKYEPKQDPNVIPVMCCDTVNRGLAYGDGKIFLHQADTTLVALDAKTGKVVWSVKDGDPSKGADRHRRAVRLQGQGADRRVGRRVRRARLGLRLQYQGRQARLARPIRKARTPTSSSIRRRPPRSASRSARIPASRPGRAISGRSAAATPGAGTPMIPSSTCLLRLGQSLDLESEAAARRQQVVDDHLGARSRHRQGQVGLPDDAPRRVGL